MRVFSQRSRSSVHHRQHGPDFCVCVWFPFGALFWPIQAWPGCAGHETFRAARVAEPTKQASVWCIQSARWLCSPCSSILRMNSNVTPTPNCIVENGNMIQASSMVSLLPVRWLNRTHDNVGLMQENRRQLGKIRVPTSEYFVSIIRTSHYLFHNTGRVQLSLKLNQSNRPPPSFFLTKGTTPWKTNTKIRYWIVAV